MEDLPRLSRVRYWVLMIISVGLMGLAVWDAFLLTGGGNYQVEIISVLTKVLTSALAFFFARQEQDRYHEPPGE